MNAGDLAMEKNDMATANAEYTAAQESAPGLVEIPFWCAVTLVNGGKVEEALPLFKSVFDREKAWAALIPRLVESEMLLNDPAVVKRILSLVP
jgi:predicted Zn-dependent protease